MSLTLRPRSASPSPLRREDVILGYQLLLGRPPVDDGEIAHAMLLGGLQGLVNDLIGREEFRERHGLAYKKWPAFASTPPEQREPVFLGDRILCWTRSGQRIFLMPQDVDLTPCILQTRDWEHHLEKAMLQMVNPGDRVIDLGANVGYHTIRLAAAVGPTGKVYAFEPHPALMRLLKATVYVNNLSDLVELHACAAGDRSDVIALAMRQDHYGSGNVSPGHGTPHFEKEYPLRVEVPMVTLDSELGDRVSAVELIHVDIEGAEPMALFGARSLIERSPLVRIFAEWSIGMMTSRADVPSYISWLTGLGFRFWMIDRADAALMPIEPSTLMDLPLCDLLISRLDPS